MKRLLMLLVGSWLLGGCASSDVNPPVARADTGYLDFYTIGGGDLNWEVSRFDARPQGCKIIYSELKPVPDGVLRLALPPGRHQVRVTFLNRVIRAPATCEVEVAARMVTPVHVVLTEDGVTQVQGRDGQDTSRYRISIVVNTPLAYRVKERMPYAQ